MPEENGGQHTLCATRQHNPTRCDAHSSTLAAMLIILEILFGEFRVLLAKSDAHAIL
jgi:hypothetical protein